MINLIKTRQHAFTPLPLPPLTAVVDLTRCLVCSSGGGAAGREQRRQVQQRLGVPQLHLQALRRPHPARPPPHAHLRQQLREPDTRTRPGAAVLLSHALSFCTRPSSRRPVIGLLVLSPPLRRGVGVWSGAVSPSCERANGWNCRRRCCFHICDIGAVAGRTMCTELATGPGVGGRRALNAEAMP